MSRARGGRVNEAGEVGRGPTRCGWWSEGRKKCEFWFSVQFAHLRVEASDL